jgi:hypothetical protein
MKKSFNNLKTKGMKAFNMVVNSVIGMILGILGIVTSWIGVWVTLRYRF